MKRWFSGLLAAVMVLLLLPASASGEDPKYYVSLGSATSAEVNKPVSVALFMRQEPGDLTYNTFFFQFSYDAESLISQTQPSATAVKLPPLSTTTLTPDC